jgi:hypothetical protein
MSPLHGILFLRQYCIGWHTSQRKRLVECCLVDWQQRWLLDAPSYFRIGLHVLSDLTANITFTQHTLDQLPSMYSRQQRYLIVSSLTIKTQETIFPFTMYLVPVLACRNGIALAGTLWTGFCGAVSFLCDPGDKIWCVYSKSTYWKQIKVYLGIGASYSSDYTVG